MVLGLVLLYTIAALGFKNMISKYVLRDFKQNILEKSLKLVQS